MLLKNKLLFICLTIVTQSIFAQDTAYSSIDSTSERSFVRVSNWIPFNAYSVAPSSGKESIDLSAMPINWASGLAFGRNESKFFRLSLIANWRIEYKYESEKGSFSMQHAGLGAILDYGGILYAGVVFPVQIPTLKVSVPQLLIGIRVAFNE
jgi:hypothetical protein